MRAAVEAPPKMRNPHLHPCDSLLWCFLAGDRENPSWLFCFLFLKCPETEKKEAAQSTQRLPQSLWVSLKAGVYVTLNSILRQGLECI